MLRSLSKGPFSIISLSFLSLGIYMKMVEKFPLKIAELFAPLFFLFNLFLAYRAWMAKKMIEAVPTMKIRSASIGMAELRGRAEKFREVKISPVFKKKCFAWIVIERHGKNRGIRRSDGYFYLNDGTGRMLVSTKGAEIDVKSMVKMLGPESSVEEKVIEPGKEYYVVGLVQDNPFVRETEAQKNYEDLMVGDGGDIFVITEGKERKLVSAYRLAVISALFCAFSGVLFLLTIAR